MDGARGPIRYPHEAAPGGTEAVEITEGVLWLRLPLPMRLDHVNVYALDDGDGWTVVDTGFDTGKARGLWQAILAGPLAGRPVRRLVATHHHPDHIGLAGWFQTAQGTELLATRTAWLYGRMLTLDRHETAKPEVLAFWRGGGMDPEIYAKRAAERPFNFADVVGEMPLGFTRLMDGGTIRMGGRDWDIRTGDGHAPEHATFWSRDDHLVIAGDQILPSISPNLGVYATEPDADPVGEWLASCTRLAAHAGEDHLVLPGHKLPFTGLPTRLAQLIDNHHGALLRLRAFLAEPRVAAECFQTLFCRSIGEAEYGLALVETMGHLNHLLAEGAVTRRRRADGAWLWQRTGA